MFPYSAMRSILDKRAILPHIHTANGGGLYLLCPETHSLAYSLSLLFSFSLAHPHPPSSLSHAIPAFTSTLLLFFSMVGSLTPLMSQHAVIALNGDNGMPCRRGRCGSVWEALRERVYRLGQNESFGAYFDALSCTMTAHFLGFRKYFFSLFVFSIGISNKDSETLNNISLLFDESPHYKL